MNAMIRKTVAMALCIAVAMVFGMGVSGGQAAAATKTKAKTMKMPTKMIIYEQQGDNKWVKRGTKTFKYNKKGDLVKYTNSREGSTVTVKYKYKKKKKVSAKAKSKYLKIDCKFNKKGQLTSVKGKDLEAKSNYTDKFKYDKKGFLTSLKWTDSNSEYTNHKGTYKYSTTFDEGGNVIINMTGKDMFGDLRASSMTLNKLGLLVDANYSGDLFSYEYDMNGDYVKQRTETIEYADGTMSVYRIVYKYGKTKAPAATYYMYINDDERALPTNL